MEKFEVGASIMLATVSIAALIGKPVVQFVVNWINRGRYIQSDYRAIRELQENCNETKQILLLLLNHLIDGNNIAEMKRTREKLIETIPTGGKKDEEN